MPGSHDHTLLSQPSSEVCTVIFIMPMFIRKETDAYNWHPVRQQTAEWTMTLELAFLRITLYHLSAEMSLNLT